MPRSSKSTDGAAGTAAIQRQPSEEEVVGEKKPKQPLRPLHFLVPLALAGLHLWYLASNKERVMTMFKQTGGSTAGMTSWTEAFLYSGVYLVVASAITRVLKARGSRNEAGVISGPVLYDPREAMVVYNLYMVALSAWMGVVMYGEMFRTDTFFWNRYRDTSPEGGALLAYAIWVNYISKPTEYVDTLFFLLRGNLRQVSFLHTSHHAVMPVIMASAVLLHPGGNSAFGPGLNSFVHTFMYLYYFVTGLGLSLPQGLKKTITIIQLVQFGLISLQALYLLVDGHFKFWHPLLGYLALLLMVQMFSLFGAFFKKAYKKKEGESDAPSSDKKGR